MNLPLQSLAKSLALLAATGLTLTAPATAQNYYNSQSGAQAIIFEHNNFGGAGLILREAVPDLRRIGLNNKASSIEVRGTWEVCVHADYGGTCRIIDQPLSELASISLNDNVSSLRPLNYGAGDYGQGYGQEGYDPYRSRDYTRGRQTGYYGNERDRYGDQRNGSRTVQFDNPRDRYGDRIRTDRRAAEDFCRDRGFNYVAETEKSGRYYGCIVCSY